MKEGYKVVWSSFAEERVDEIFEYYKTEASLTIAIKITTNIIRSTDRLINNPYIGQIEELLTDREERYRYLLHKHYKIIYSVDLNNGFIKIADVFDTRQNPVKMRRNK